jgi:hypothetical protein
MSDLRSILTSWHEEAGELTPQIVVDKARPEGAPLHDRFEWDDGIAGEKYRLVQAQQIIRSVKIEYTSSATGEKRSVRAFFSNREAGDPNRQGYRPTEEIVEDDLALKLLLRDLERDIAELKRRYGHLAEFADIVRRGIA